MGDLEGGMRLGRYNSLVERMRGCDDLRLGEVLGGGGALDAV